MWQAAKGAQTVVINGKAAYRKGDKSQHCGGVGKLIEGSGDVIVGDETPGGSASQLASASASTSVQATSDASHSNKQSREAAMASQRSADNQSKLKNKKKPFHFSM